MSSSPAFIRAALEQPFLQALAQRGDNRRVIYVPYNQLHTFLLYPRSLIPEETPATVIFLCRAEDLIRLELAGGRSDDHEACVRIFRERTAQFLDVLSQIPEVSLTLLSCPCGRGAYDVSFLGNALRVAEYRTIAELRRKQRHLRRQRSCTT